MKLYKNEEDGVLFGVCEGLGECLGIHPIILRMMFLLIPNMGLLYLVCCLSLKEKDHNEGS